MTHKILIVEDDPVFRNYLYQVLKYDFTVTAVPGPLEALEALGNDSFPVMITDLRMPDMDGKTLVEKVHKELDPNIIVIVITAFEDDWPIDSAMTCSVFRYLRKGAFLPSELKQNVEKAFEVRGSIVSLQKFKKRADASEIIYKDICSKTSDSLFFCDVNLKPITLNRAFEELCGYTINELKDSTLLDIIHQDDKEVVLKALDAQLKGDPPALIKVNIQTKDGCGVYVEFWARLINDFQGLAHAIFGIVRPVSLGKGSQGRYGKNHSDLENLIEMLKDQIKQHLDIIKRLTMHTSDIIIRLNGDFTCMYANDEFERVLGFTPAETEQQPIPWKTLLHPDDRPLMEKWQDALRKRQSSVVTEVRVFNKLKYLLYLFCRAFIDYNPDGSLKYIEIFAEDITQRKIAEIELRKANRKIQEFNDRITNGVGKKIQELKNSAERYRRIVEESSDVIFSLDEAGIVIYMNKRGLQSFGMTSSEIYGRPFHEFIVDKISHGKIIELKDSLQGINRTTSLDVPVETVVGKKTWRISLKRIVDNRQEHNVCVARDISDETTKNKRLQLLANIEHYSADAIIGLDTNKNIISWNQGACMMFGWSEKDVLGKPLLVIIPENQIQESQQILDRVVSTGFVKDIETTRKTKSGLILDVLLTVTAIKDEQGTIFGFSSIIRDITAQKKMESALIQTERLAATGKLAASIAHEINNPLYGIRSCLNHVLNAGDDGFDRQFVRLAVKETDRIADLIRNMKTFYMSSDGKAREIDINELLKETFMLNRKYLEDNRVKLKFTKSNDVKIECIPDQIKQVVINLIANAVEAMPSGGVLSVETKAFPNADNIDIVFADTGVGIAKEDLSHIFDMFYTKKPKVKGVGLGLSVSYGIVKYHGGTIDVKSDEGKGSRFTLTLPVKSHGARQLYLDLK
ncbi:MAG: PAS domain S-box protein [Deltaproteobacteria bacterium]|nr:PAS domain S-box protein [Deltaproteobacteria bacterium]